MEPNTEGQINVIRKKLAERGCSREGEEMARERERGREMKIKSHVMSPVLRNGGYTVSNLGFSAVSFR